MDYNIMLCLIFKASHLWDASRIWVKGGLYTYNTLIREYAFNCEYFIFYIQTW